jgi:hypothetical protein
MYQDPFENMYAGWSSENPCISQIWGGTFQYWADLKTVGATRETLKFSLDDIMTAAPYQVIVPGVVLTAKGESAQQPPFGRPAMFACIHIEPST